MNNIEVRMFGGFKMKKTIIAVFVLLLLVQSVVVTALTASEAKQEWFAARDISKEVQEEYRAAKLTYAADQSDDNNQAVIDSGKELLNAALDEVEAWLNWKELEVKENPEVPENLKDEIEDDVQANLAKIDTLRNDVDNVQTRFELGVVFLKMIGKYTELLSDVARNSGKVWVYLAETHSEKIETYEAQLRESANGNDVVIEKLDLALSELESAKNNIENSERAYNLVKIPGTPLIKFSEGNNYLKIARTNMLSAHGYLNQAYSLILQGGE